MKSLVYKLCLLPTITSQHTCTIQYKQECGEKQALIERTQREKKAVERELERVRERGPVESARAAETLQQLQHRLHEAERAGEEARRRTENALMAQQTAEARCMYMYYAYMYNLFLHLCMYTYVGVRCIYMYIHIIIMYSTNS